jgi:preprotein translocase subunit SecF
MIEFLKEVPSIRFMALRRWWYVISAAVVVASIVLVMVRGLNLTVDFTGGLVFEVGFSQPVDLEEVRARRGRHRGLPGPYLRHRERTRGAAAARRDRGR